MAKENKSSWNQGSREAENKIEAPARQNEKTVRGVLVAEKDKERLALVLRKKGFDVMTNVEGEENKIFFRRGENMSSEQEQQALELVDNLMIDSKIERSQGAWEEPQAFKEKIYERFGEKEAEIQKEVGKIFDQETGAAKLDDLFRNGETKKASSGETIEQKDASKIIKMSLKEYSPLTTQMSEDVRYQAFYHELVNQWERDNKTSRFINNRFYQANPEFKKAIPALEKLAREEFVKTYPVLAKKYGLIQKAENDKNTIVDQKEATRSGENAFPADQERKDGAPQTDQARLDSLRGKLGGITRKINFLKRKGQAENQAEIQQLEEDKNKIREQHDLLNNKIKTKTMSAKLDQMPKPSSKAAQQEKFDIEDPIAKGEAKKIARERAANGQERISYDIEDSIAKREAKRIARENKAEEQERVNFDIEDPIAKGEAKKIIKKKESGQNLAEASPDGEKNKELQEVSELLSQKGNWQKKLDYLKNKYGDQFVQDILNAGKDNLDSYLGQEKEKIKTEIENETPKMTAEDLQKIKDEIYTDGGEYTEDFASTGQIEYRKTPKQEEAKTKSSNSSVDSDHPAVKTKIEIDDDDLAENEALDVRQARKGGSAEQPIGAADDDDLAENEALDVRQARKGGSAEQPIWAADDDDLAENEALDIRHARVESGNVRVAPEGMPGAEHMADLAENEVMDKNIDRRRRKSPEQLRQELDENLELFREKQSQLCEAYRNVGFVSRLADRFSFRGMKRGRAWEEYRQYQNEMIAARARYRRSLGDYGQHFVDLERERLQQGGVDPNSQDFKDAIFQFMHTERMVDTGENDEAGNEVKRTILEEYNTRLAEIDRIPLEQRPPRDRNFWTALRGTYQRIPTRNKRIIATVLCSAGAASLVLATGGSGMVALGVGAGSALRSVARIGAFAGGFAGMGAFQRWRDRITGNTEADFSRRSEEAFNNTLNQANLNEVVEHGLLEGLDQRMVVLQQHNERQQTQMRNRLIAGAALGAATSFSMRGLVSQSTFQHPVGWKDLNMGHAGPTGGSMSPDGWSDAGIGRSVKVPFQDLESKGSVGHSMVGGKDLGIKETPWHDLESKKFSGSPRMGGHDLNMEAHHSRPTNFEDYKGYSRVGGNDVGINSGVKDIPFGDIESKGAAGFSIEGGHSGGAEIVYSSQFGKGDSVWGNLAKHFGGSDRATANSIVDFKKDMVKQLHDSHGMNQKQALRYINWRFHHIQPGESLTVDGHGKIHINGFADEKHLNIFHGGKDLRQKMLEDYNDYQGPKRILRTPSGKAILETGQRPSAEEINNLMGNAKVTDYSVTVENTLGGLADNFSQIGFKPGEYEQIMNVKVGKLLEEIPAKKTAADVLWRSQIGSSGAPGVDTIDLPHHGVYGHPEFSRQWKLRKIIAEYLDKHPEEKTNIMNKSINEFFSTMNQNQG